MAVNLDIQQQLYSTPTDPEDHITELLQLYEGTSCTSAMWFSGGTIHIPLQAARTNGYLTNGSSNGRTTIPPNLQAVLIKPSSQDGDIIGLVKAFGLKKNGMLFANDHCIAKDCTSFLISENHLIFTTSQHLLKFVHLDNSTKAQGQRIP